MPCRLSHGYLGHLRVIPRVNYIPSCLICTLTTSSSHGQPFTKKKATTCLKRNQQAQTQINLHSKASTDRAYGTADRYGDIFILKSALIELQKRARNYVNLSRLQLALRGLEQYPGEETIRVAVLGCAGKGRISHTLRELVRLLVADPLKDEEEWERILTAENQDMSTLLRVGEDTGNNALHSDPGNKLMRELDVSSPVLNKSRLEIFILDADVISNNTTTKKESLIEAILAPSVDVPISNTGRYTPVTTPVHKAMVIGEGIFDAASLLNLPMDADGEVIVSAVDLPGYVHEDTRSLPFLQINVGLAKEALLKIRKTLDNAMVYEHDWFNSGLPKLLDWLKDGTLNTPGGERIKRPIRNLISSVLTDCKRRIQLEESRRASGLLASKVSPEVLKTLRNEMKTWAERAHTELRDQLDIAFEGKRWSKLGWWKLFWRVDDVSMIASDMLKRRFLFDAEKEIIYLAGRIEEAGVPKSLKVEDSLAYNPIPKPFNPTNTESSPGDIYYKDIIEMSDDSVEKITPRPWPLHIPIVRSYLLADTIPALQALAQKLVLQTVTNSSFAAILSGLIYMSSISTGFYEAGAFAAIGVVWSLRRMQKRWEIARSFWEGEVREEGRKTVRAVEVVVGEVLSRAEAKSISTVGSEELNRARDSVERAEEAFTMVAGKVR
jgi:hypothetical protein